MTVEPSLFRTLSGFTAMVSLLFAWDGARAAFADAPIKADKGTFVLYSRGVKVGTVPFAITADGGSQTSVTLAQGGKQVKIATTITASKNRLTSVTSEAQPGGKFIVTINGPKGKVEIPAAPAQNKEVPLPEPLYPFGTYMPHLMVNALAGYDARKGGKQRFYFITAEQGMLLEGQLNREGDKTVKIKGKPVKVTRYTLSELGNQALPTKVSLDLVVDSSRRMLLWFQSGPQYLTVRDGYQELARALSYPVGK